MQAHVLGLDLGLAIVTRTIGGYRIRVVIAGFASLAGAVPRVFGMSGSSSFPGGSDEPDILRHPIISSCPIRADGGKPLPIRGLRYTLAG